MYVAVAQLGVLVGQWEQRLSLILSASFWDPYPVNGLPHTALIWAKLYCNILFHIWFIYLEGFSEGKQNRSGYEGEERLRWGL